MAQFYPRHYLSSLYSIGIVVSFQTYYEIWLYPVGSWPRPPPKFSKLYFCYSQVDSTLEGSLLSFTGYFNGKAVL